LGLLLHLLFLLLLLLLLSVALRAVYPKYVSEFNCDGKPVDVRDPIGMTMMSNRDCDGAAMLICQFYNNVRALTPAARGRRHASEGARRGRRERQRCKACCGAPGRAARRRIARAARPPVCRLNIHDLITFHRRRQLALGCYGKYLDSGGWLCASWWIEGHQRVCVCVCVFWKRPWERLLA
jgi:hypothetical protein